MRSPSTGRVEVPFSARFHLARSGRNPDGMLVEGLRISRRTGCGVRHGLPGAGDVTAMSEPAADAAFHHVPVMVEEVVALLRPSPPGVLLDATLGGAGHARALLDSAPQLRLVGLDQDPAALVAARSALEPYGGRAQVLAARFDRLADALDDLGVTELSAALFDLGVSSPQLDQPVRGFSYRNDALLDMRMDTGQDLTAADVVNGWAPADLVALLRANGEGRFASRIVRAMVAARPIRTTTELASVVRDAIPAATRRTGGHPARRVFQAIRIAVNEELDVLQPAIDAALAALGPGGRCAVISYHSGEDRIVKDRFRQAATGGCVCPPGLPCVCGATPTVRLLTRGALRPRPEEIAANRRAESARLRAAERLPTAGAVGNEGRP